MRILFCGDVVSRAGRQAILEKIPELKQQLKLDCVIVNVDNAANGFGVTKKICDEFTKAGVDVLTGGDHIWDQKETLSFISNYPTLLRPLNFPEQTPGNGMRVHTTSLGQKILVVHLMAQVFMKYSLDCPFACMENVLKRHRLQGTADVIIVDFHGEASSEKMAMGHFLDGRVSLVVGTHTHVPTADTMVLPKGTAYQTDAGMCGDYHSVIGFDTSAPLKHFVQKMKLERLTPAQENYTLCGVYLETDDRTGLAKKVTPIRVGATLSQAIPA